MVPSAKHLSAAGPVLYLKHASERTVSLAELGSGINGAPIPSNAQLCVSLWCSQGLGRYKAPRRRGDLGHAVPELRTMLRPERMVCRARSTREQSAAAKLPLSL